MPIKLLAVVMAGFALFAVSACNNDDDDTTPTTVATTETVTSTTNATTTPAPTATLAPGACPIVATACTQARALLGLLRRGNFQAIAEAAETRLYTCPGGRPSGAGGPFPLCEGSSNGTVLTGIGVARRYSEGSVLSIDAYTQGLRNFVDAARPSVNDADGTGELRLAAVSCRDATQQPTACTTSVAIFTAIVQQGPLLSGGSAGGRELLLFYLDTNSAFPDVKIVDTWTGIVEPGEEATLFRTGGVLFDIGRVFPLPPEAPLPGHSPSTRTGNAEVDAVINAVLSGDPARVADLLQYYPLGCEVEPFGIGSPPKCAPGVPHGTPVEVFPNGSCPEGRFTTRGDETFVELLAEDSARLFAAYTREPVERSGLDWPRGSVGLVFTAPDLQHNELFWLEVDGGRVVVAGIACPDQPPMQLLENLGANGFLLPPR